MKRHILTDANGVPLVVRTGPANRPDHEYLEGMVGALPEMPTVAGRPRKVLEIMADAGYGIAAILAWVIALGYRCKIKPRGNAGKVHGSGLGRRRYVVERTHAWFGNYRRLRVCYERTGRSTQAFHELAACLICVKCLEKRRKRPKKAR